MRYLRAWRAARPFSERGLSQRVKDFLRTGAFLLRGFLDLPRRGPDGPIAFFGSGLDDGLTRYLGERLAGGAFDFRHRGTRGGARTTGTTTGLLGLADDIEEERDACEVEALVDALDEEALVGVLKAFLGSCRRDGNGSDASRPASRSST
jgi:hypothetical protein